MVVTNDRGNLRICVHVCQDSFSDLGVTLHLPPFLQGERSRLFKKTGWEADLADVVDQPANTSKVLLFCRETHADCDVEGVDRHSTRVSSCVAVSRVERSDEGGGE